MVVPHVRAEAARLSSEQASFASARERRSAIAEALDIRSLFLRVSRMANALLPHDALLLAFVDGTGRLRVHATTGFGLARRGARLAMARKMFATIAANCVHCHAHVAGSGSDGEASWMNVISWHRRLLQC